MYYIPGPVWIWLYLRFYFPYLASRLCSRLGGLVFLSFPSLEPYTLFGYCSHLFRSYGIVGRRMIAKSYIPFHIEDCDSSRYIPYHTDTRLRLPTTIIRLPYPHQSNDTSSASLSPTPFGPHNHIPHFLFPACCRTTAERNTNTII
jgi:hypothetical protein